jgi:transposase
MAQIPGPDRSEPAGIHRRDLDEDQHDAHPWLGTARPKARRQDTAWSLENLDLRGGAGHDRIDAPCLFDGPINGQRFLAYVEQSLVPALKPGDVVILDNLGSHKGRAVRRTIRQAGAKLIFLPKYSPDLNPIEQLFAKLKALLRKAMPRTTDAVCSALAEILDALTPSECANYLKNSGYAST